jgi:hypothetical protein
MSRTHQLIFLLIAALAIGTFIFGVLQLVGVGRKPAEPPPEPETRSQRLGSETGR